MSPRGPGRRLARDEQSGAAAIEFALMAGFLLIPMMFGMLQYGWYFAVDSATSSAANQVARRISVGDCWLGTDAADLVASRVSAPTTIATLPDPATLAVGDVFTVTVTSEATVAPFFPMPNDGVITVVVTSRIEDLLPGLGGC